MVVAPSSPRIVSYITHHGIYQWLTMLSRIRASEIESEAKLINYVSHYLVDIEIQKFSRLAGASAGTTLIAGQFLFSNSNTPIPLFASSQAASPQPDQHQQRLHCGFVATVKTPNKRSKANLSSIMSPGAHIQLLHSLALLPSRVLIRSNHNSLWVKFFVIQQLFLQLDSR